jgi:hypothetical protein
VAAHICAASPGGPRYDTAQIREVRRARDNGIWLCQNCGRLVDADAQKFTIEVLTNWKRAAQDRAFRELVSPDARLRDEDVTRVGLIIASDNASAEDSSLDNLFERVYAAASADLSALKRTPIWSGSLVELTLQVYDAPPTSPSFTISKLPMAVEIAPEVVIVAPPGTGKDYHTSATCGANARCQVLCPSIFPLGRLVGKLGKLGGVTTPAFRFPGYKLRRSSSPHQTWPRVAVA